MRKFLLPGTLISLLFLLLHSCAALKKTVNYEKYSKGTKIEVKSLSFLNEYFSFTVAMDSDNQMTEKDLSVNASKVLALTLAGDIKKLLEDLKLKLSLEASNAYPFAFKISEVVADVIFSGEKLTTLTYKQPFVIKENEKKPVEVTLDIPSSVKFSKVLESESAVLKGYASVSLVADGQTLPAIKVNFEEEVDIPSQNLLEKINGLGIDLN